MLKVNENSPVLTVDSPLSLGFHQQLEELHRHNWNRALEVLSLSEAAAIAPDLFQPCEFKVNPQSQADPEMKVACSGKPLINYGGTAFNNLLTGVELTEFFLIGPAESPSPGNHTFQLSTLATVEYIMLHEAGHALTLAALAAAKDWYQPGTPISAIGDRLKSLDYFLRNRCQDWHEGIAEMVAYSAIEKSGEESQLEYASVQIAKRLGLYCVNNALSDASSEKQSILRCFPGLESRAPRMDSIIAAIIENGRQIQYQHPVYLDFERFYSSGLLNLAKKVGSGHGLPDLALKPYRSFYGCYDDEP